MVFGIAVATTPSPSIIFFVISDLTTLITSEEIALYIDLGISEGDFGATCKSTSF